MRLLIGKDNDKRVFYLKASRITGDAVLPRSGRES